MPGSQTDRFYLTTPIYYASDVPHLGHAYTTIVGDALCRYQRIRRGAANVFYLTGTDEHGEKLERAAQEREQEPQAYAAKVSAVYADVWRALHIRNDDFIRTTEARHQEVVQWMWRTMAERGDIYKSHYEGLYCVACEAFYLEKDLLPGQLCPDHKRKTERVKEEGYFFRLSKYEKPLLDHYAAHPDFVEPDFRLNEVRTFVERGLRDLSVSRSTFSWGVPVPGEPGHVVYVWIDALTNYYSALQEPPERRAFWGTKEHPLAIHLIGKEISRFHAVYWPAMLLSAGLPLPRKVFAHGWWTVDGEKMSKTLGNVVDPKGLAADIGADALRYFLLREVPLGQDGDFSYDALLGRYNSELANDLGNLLHRSLSMLELYCGGVLRCLPQDEAGTRLADKAKAARDRVEEAMEKLAPSRALDAIFSFVRECNGYLEQEAPFTRVKTDPRGADRILYNVLEALRWLSLLLAPVMPERAAEMRRQLGLPEDSQAGAEWPQAWGGLPEGTAVRKRQPLFPRIDKDQKEALLARWRAGRRATATATEEMGGWQSEPLSFEDFKRLELRAARVIAAERVPKKDRLLKVTLSLGDAEGQRTVVAGLAETVKPEELLGRTVVLLCNLKPAKIGGILSEGMILAAGGDKVLGLLTVDRDVPPGTPIR